MIVCVLVTIQVSNSCRLRRRERRGKRPGGTPDPGRRTASPCTPCSTVAHANGSMRWWEICSDVLVEIEGQTRYERGEHNRPCRVQLCQRFPWLHLYSSILLDCMNHNHPLRNARIRGDALYCSY